VIDSNEADLLANFILTVGVVSNHGNWFTAEKSQQRIESAGAILRLAGFFFRTRGWLNSSTNFCSIRRHN